MRKVTTRVGFVLASVALAVLPSGPVHGQDQGASGGGSIGGAASIEQGEVGGEAAASGGGSPAASSTPSYAPSDPGFVEPAGESSEARLGIQARIDALNAVELVAPIGQGIGPTVPLVTPGVRFVDGKLFLGLGLGLTGGSNDMGGGDRGQSGFSVSPLFSYDIVSDAVAALHLVGWFNLASLGEEEDCNAAGTCMDQGNDADGLGLNVGAGVRGKLSEGLAIGGEFGWGFMSGEVGNSSYFNHGLIGTLLFEASVGL